MCMLVSNITFETLSHHGKNFVVLSDNMSIVLALSKGRCCEFSLPKQVRKVAALLLATGARLRVRWIPSEVNPADEGSRVYEKKASRQRGAPCPERLPSQPGRKACQGRRLLER